MFRHSFPLFEEPRDPPGGAPGGGDPKPFTDDQLKAIGGLISGAMKGEGKRQVTAAVTEAIGALKLGETIAAEVAKLKPADPPPDPKGPDKKPDPEVAALKAKLEEVTANLKTEAAERAKAVEAGKNEKAFAALKTALGPHVRPEALEIAASHLFVAQKRVSIDEAGNPLLTIRKAPFAGAAEEDVAMPLADGLQHWLKSTEGKFFVPAPGGAPPGGPPGPRRHTQTGPDGLPHYDTPATTDVERQRRAAEKAEALSIKYPHLARNP